MKYQNVKKKNMSISNTWAKLTVKGIYGKSDDLYTVWLLALAKNPFNWETICFCWWGRWKNDHFYSPLALPSVFYFL